MNIQGIEQRSCAGEADLSEFYAAGTRRPVVLTDGFDHWPARRKWSWNFFGSRCRDDIGKLTAAFDDDCVKLLTKVGVFIESLDEPLESIPGFWLDGDERPCARTPDLGSVGSGWSFCWNSFCLHPELRADILPFPACVPNMVATLSAGMLDLLEAVCQMHTSAIYLSRRGAVAPFHVDFHHTFGSLFQFEGTKKVWLIQPTPGLGNIPASFDPQDPDFGQCPELDGLAFHHAELEPGQCVIMPPDWWHYTRATEHSLTLSCNFFNQFNHSEFVGAFLKAALESDHRAQFLAMLDELERRER